MRKSIYFLFLILIVILSGCSRDFKSEITSPAKIKINSAWRTFDRVCLAWNYPTGLATSNIGSYELYRATSNVVNIVTANLIATIGNTLNVYEDTGLASNTQYSYRLLYRDFLNPSLILDLSDVLRITTLVPSDVIFSMVTGNAVVSGNVNKFISMHVDNYYPVLSFELLRATGNNILVAPIVVFAGQFSAGSTFNYTFQETTINYSYQSSGNYTYSAPTLLNQLYTYQSYVVIPGVATVNSPVVQMTW